MALTNMHSDLRFNPSSGLAFFYVLVWLPYSISHLGPGCNKLIIYAGPLSCILGCNQDNSHLYERFLSNNKMYLEGEIHSTDNYAQFSEMYVSYGVMVLLCILL